MTREEQIKKQADIYTDDASNYTEWSDDGGWSDTNDIDLVEKAFIEGAKWADKHPKSPWISVEDDLPCNHEELMAKRLFSYEKETVHVLTLLPDGGIVIDFMVHNRGKWKWWSHRRPTHWFPIPKLPKEQEVELWN